MNLPHVCVMTPTYGGMVTAEFMDSFIRHLQQPDHITSYRYLAGDSLVSRARNHLLADFVAFAEPNGWTHLLWQDGDVGLAPEAISRMLSRGVDVIAAPVPLKTNLDRHGWPMSVVGLVDEVEPMLYRVEYAATGCLMLSRKAVDALVRYCKDNGREYYDNGVRWDVFRNGSDRGFYESEDWHVCRILREIGFDIYADSSFWVSHVDAPRHRWVREAWPLAETLVAGDLAGSLPDDVRAQRWATNDYDMEAQTALAGTRR